MRAYRVNHKEDDTLHFFPSRTICDALEAIRRMHGTHNYSQLMSCVEEIQYAANRMEAALEDQKDIIKIRTELAKLKKEYRKKKKRKS